MHNAKIALQKCNFTSKPALSQCNFVYLCGWIKQRKLWNNYITPIISW